MGYKSIKIYKSSANHLQDCILYHQSLIQLYSITSPFSPSSPPVRESSTHEQPFLISHTFEKCQKCFMWLVSAQLVQSDVRKGLIKAAGRGAKGFWGDPLRALGPLFGLEDETSTSFCYPSDACVECATDVFFLSLKNQIAELPSAHH